jgi:Zn-dependent protease/predicted transcriptional regulator
MRFAWRLGKAFGIDVYVHATFLLLLAWVAWSSWGQTGTAAGTLIGVGLILAVFGIVVLHELGHALMARRFGIPTRDITLYPIGGVARLERIPEQPSQELAVAVAGPLVNVGLALLIGTALVLTGGTLVPDEKAVGTLGSIPVQLFWINVMLAVFNLLPAFPMDGGRVLRALLSMRLGPVEATAIAARIGQTLALGLGVLGILYAPTLLLIAVFVWVGAASEAGAVQTKAALHSLPVRSAMMREIRSLDEETTIGEAVRAHLASPQADFPVVRGDALVGVLPRAVLLAALAERGSDARVGDVATRDFAIADPDEPLDVALTRLEAAACRVMPVMRGTALLGLITPEHLGEVLLVQDAMRRAEAAHRVRRVAEAAS